MIKGFCYAANFIPSTEKKNDTNTFFDCVNEWKESEFNSRIWVVFLLQ